jgi:cytochrome P450
VQAAPASMNVQWPAGPPGHWLSGHLRELRRDRLAFLSSLAGNYGDFVPLRVRRRIAVFVNDPVHIETMVFQRAGDYSKNNLSDFFNPAVLRLLRFEESTSWLKQRRLAQPALRPERMPAYAEIMVKSAERMCDGWQDAQVIDVAAEMRRLTLDILARSLFDLDLAEMAGDAPAIFDAILEDVGARAFSPLYLSFLLTGSNWRSRARFLQGERMLDALIAKRRLETDGRADLLSALVRQGEGMSDDEVKLIVVPLIFAGHETTATALTWTLHLLANHPNVALKLRTELETILGCRPVTGDDVAALPYTGAVVHESLRLYPPIWGFGRQAMRDTEFGPYRIPTGTILFASQWVLQRDSRYFTDPLRFDPDRWSNGLVTRLPRCVYMPFGVGPRRCLGSTFAILELVTALATVCRRFDLEPVARSEPQLEPLITLRAKNSRLTVRRRPQITNGSTLSALG